MWSDSRLSSWKPWPSGPDTFCMIGITMAAKMTVPRRPSNLQPPDNGGSVCGVAGYLTSQQHGMLCTTLKLKALRRPPFEAANASVPLWLCYLHLPNNRNGVQAQAAHKVVFCNHLGSLDSLCRLQQWCPSQGVNV